MSVPTFDQNFVERKRAARQQATLDFQNNRGPKIYVPPNSEKPITTLNQIGYSRPVSEHFQEATGHVICPNCKNATSITAETIVAERNMNFHLLCSCYAPLEITGTAWEHLHYYHQIYAENNYDERAVSRAKKIPRLFTPTNYGPDGYRYPIAPVSWFHNAQWWATKPPTGQLIIVRIWSTTDSRAEIRTINASRLAQGLLQVGTLPTQLAPSIRAHIPIKDGGTSTADTADTEAVLKLCFPLPEDQTPQAPVTLTPQPISVPTPVVTKTPPPAVPPVLQPTGFLKRLAKLAFS